MKLGLFADPHYSSKAVTCGIRYNSQSLRKIREAYDCFEKEKCDLIVCLGDLIDTEIEENKVKSNLLAIADVIHSVDVPTVCIMGNHDAFSLGADEFYSVLGDCRPRDIETHGKRLIFLDACYYKSGERYAKGDGDWTDTFYPQAPQLRNVLDNSDGDVYLFIHQNIDPAVDAEHRLHNADSLFNIINESRVVKIVFQGHFHAGCRSEYDGVKYITLPAMCQNEGAYYVFEI